MKLAIVGIWYDGYYDLWEDFLDLFFRFWPDCPYPLYIIDQEKDLNFPVKYNATILHAGKDAEYSRKVQLAVREIDADYYLFLLEDFFIGKRLSANVLTEVMESMVNNNIKYYQMPIKEFIQKKDRGKIISITASMDYTLTCQPSIWRKDFLTQCIGTRNYNAWIFEGIYKTSSVAHSDEFLNGCFVDYCNRLDLHHGALQGKILHSAYNYFNKIGYHFHTSRQELGIFGEIKHKLKQLCINLIPLKLHKYAKRIMHYKSVTGRYEKEINALINEMNL